MGDTGRLYAGRSEEQRRSERRDRLVAAGLELFGTEGWTGATIERLCAAAGVATRSFYEEFTSREALLRAVYEDIMAGLVASVLPILDATPGSLEVRMRAGLGGYVSYLTVDPRRARVVHREVRAAGVLEKDRYTMVLRFAELMAERLPFREGATGRVTALALAGAATEVLVDWVAQPEPRPDTGPIIDTLVLIYVAAVRPQ